MKIKAFIKNRYTKIEQTLTHYKESCTPEDLHQYRVEVKKLKALFSLLDYTNPDFKKKKELSIHQKIFRKSGAIRDTDVIQELIKSQPVPKEISLKRKKNIKEFNQKISGYLIKMKKTKNNLIKKGKTIQSKQLKHYLNKRKKDIAKQLKKKSYQKQLHRIRKLCKQIIYLSPLLKHKAINLYTDLDQLQEYIGKWHNEQLLIKREQGKKNKSLSTLKRRAQSLLQQISLLREDYLHHNTKK